MTIKEFTRLSKVRQETINELKLCTHMLTQLRSLLHTSVLPPYIHKGIGFNGNINKDTNLSFNLRILGKWHQYSYDFKHIQNAIIDMKDVKKTLDYELSRIDKQILSLEVNNVQ